MTQRLCVLQGGAARAAFYGNMKTAVNAIHCGKDRAFKDRTMFEVFEAEWPCLIGYREPFDSYRSFKGWDLPGALGRVHRKFKTIK
jgi:hypothetical protein